MNFTSTAIPDVLLIEPQVHDDGRGFFMETYETRKFNHAGIKQVFVQDNHSGSAQGTLRGLHYQIKQTQGKLVRAVAGEIYDVAVDLRCSSKTFGHWVGTHLSAQNRLQLWIPEGFAHGFYVLSEWAEVTYKVTDFYAPRWERTLLWNDPLISIKWPLVAGRVPTLSAKDSTGNSFDRAELFD